MQTFYANADVKLLTAKIAKLAQRSQREKLLFALLAKPLHEQLFAEAANQNSEKILGNYAGIRRCQM